jgi:hypothetical protein
MDIAEQTRLEESKNGLPWKKFGPYLAERQWGTVREDYSKFGGAWEFFSHDDSRSRVYRWGEDGIAGISDDQQLLCFALAFWNGKDTILKERLFGLTGNEGNHSEDVKELYYYLDSTPTHSYMKYLYKYPQNAYPYSDLVVESAVRDEHDPEYELKDTGIFDNNEYFDIYIEYAKADEEDIVIKVTAHNRSANAAPLHLLPTVWFRNTWSWNPNVQKPVVRSADSSSEERRSNLSIYHPELGWYYLSTEGKVEKLFTDNETNAERLFNLKSKAKYVKDAFHEYVIDGKYDKVNPENRGTKAALHYKLDIPAGLSETIYLRLSKDLKDGKLNDEETVKLRLSEADQFYNDLQKNLSDEQKTIQRQAFAGMMWGKQYYNFNVADWFNGDPGQHSPPEVRKKGRNAGWAHLDCHDIITMPDKWEYPWFAAWDTAFHCIPIAHIDPEFAKLQMKMFLEPRYMNENGQIPAYEWAFGDVNPPVHAYGCWNVYEIEKKKTGKGDLEFLDSIYKKLKENYEWWIETQTVSERYLFGGGFLGLDNVGLLDRGAPLPEGAWLEQVDGTCWMALYSLNMMRISLELSVEDDDFEKDALYYTETFLKIVYDMNHVDYGCWGADDNFFSDTIRFVNGKRIRMNIKNIVDLMTLYPIELLNKELLERNPGFLKGLIKLQKQYPQYISASGDTYLLKAVTDKQFEKSLENIYNEKEFFAPFGIRSLSKYYDENPFHFELAGKWHTLQYKPAESDTTSFGENSNWRGPVWFPVNFVLIDALIKYGLIIKSPNNSPEKIITRLISIFLQKDNNHEGNILFYEFFNPETGKGCGASHQTGWTGLVATLIFKLKELKA